MKNKILYYSVLFIFLAGLLSVQILVLNPRPSKAPVSDPSDYFEKLPENDPADDFEDISFSDIAEPEPEPELPDSVTIQMGGDVLIHKTVYSAAQTGSASYDFSPYFSLFKDVFVSDLNIVNLEGPVDAYGGNNKIATYPEFNMPLEILSALKEINIDLCTTANNHSADKGYSGLVNTLKSLKTIGIDSVGTYDSQEAHDTSYIVDINNIKVGVASYTTYVQGKIKSSVPYCVNVTGDKEKEIISSVKSGIDKLKADGAEFIIVAIHWGTEYKDAPSSVQKKVAKQLCEYGADVIMGGHSHCVQPIELLTVDRGGVESKALVIYSLGNFFVNQDSLNKPKTQEGMVVSVKAVRGEDGYVRLVDSFYMPTFTYVRGTKGSDYMRIVAAGEYAFDNTLPSVFKDEAAWKKCKNAWNNVNKTVGSAIPSVTDPSAYPEGFFSAAAKNPDSDSTSSDSPVSAQPEESTSAVNVDLNEYAEVVVKSAAFRKSNSTDSELIRYLSKGKKVIVLDVKKSWYKVDYNGTTGWIYATALEMVRDPAREAVLYEPVPQLIPGKIQSLAKTPTAYYIDQIAKEHAASGLTVAVIKNGNVAYHYEYGHVTKKDKAPATVNTKFRIASLSKVFTSMMAMKLAEEGKLDLDKHIGDILGMTIQNPNHEGLPITTKMLLTHTSSFIDKSRELSSMQKEFESKYSYTSAKPGAKHIYSNFGMGVAGAVVEASSGMHLTNYAQTAFFDEMGIDAGYDGSKLKSSLDIADCLNRGNVERSANDMLLPRETNPVGYNYTLAAGGLLISAVDMGKVTSILLNDGVYDGKRYLSENTIKEFHTPQLQTDKYSQCIGIRRSDTILPNRTMYYHTGAAYGVFSLMAYDLEDKSGVVVFTTGALDFSDDNEIRTVCSDTLKLIYNDILK